MSAVFTDERPIDLVNRLVFSGHNHPARIKDRIKQEVGIAAEDTSKDQAIMDQVQLNLNELEGQLRIFQCAPGNYRTRV